MVSDMRKNFTVNGKYFMVYCPKCNRENWAPAVADGQCAWCSYKEEVGSDIQRIQE